MRRLIREQQREIAVVAAKRDEEIDLSEMPEVVDWSGAEVGKFYRPPKRPVDYAPGRRHRQMVKS